MGVASDHSSLISMPRSVEWPVAARSALTTLMSSLGFVFKDRLHQSLAETTTGLQLWSKFWGISVTLIVHTSLLCEYQPEDPSIPRRRFGAWYALLIRYVYKTHAVSWTYRPFALANGSSESLSQSHSPWASTKRKTRWSITTSTLPSIHGSCHASEFR